MYGHLNLCETLINKHNFNVDIADDSGWTPLHFSTQNGSYALVKFFSDKITDIYVKTIAGENCLHIAARKGCLNLCKTLIDKYNFNMNLTDNEGWAALHHSAHNGSYELVKFFVEMGADIHLKVNNGAHCLHIAALKRHLDLFKTLINKHNFNIDMADNEGFTALHRSAANGIYELVNFFSDTGLNIHQEAKIGGNCLHTAAAYVHLNLCKTLINKHDFDVDMTDNEGFTALHRSAQSGVYELVKLFADIRGDIHLKTKVGEDCLHIAAAYGHLNLCKTLIDKHDFDVDMTDNEGFTALHRSVQSGDYELVKLFADIRGDIHLKTKVGEDCLHIAAAYEHLNLCKKLIDKHNFDVDMTDNEGFTALHRSAQSGVYELVKLFADIGGDIHLKTKVGEDCLHIAAAYGHLNLCKKLIDKHNFDVDMTDNEGFTALYRSAQSGVYELVKLFADIGGDIHLKTKVGEDCLHIAAAYGHLNLCKKLIDKHNFDVDMTDNEGFTALYRSAQSGVYELVKLFADIGGDIHLKTKVGGDCFHIAAAYGHTSLLQDTD